MMDLFICPVCAHKLKLGLTEWHFICPSCSYEFSKFGTAINSENANNNVNELSRITGLKSLRQSNFIILVNVLKRLMPKSGGRLLDVGSAHGWFLDAAKEHFTVLGIEPDNQVYKVACDSGKPVRLGLFPNALDEHEVFEVIIFNDVIEHIENISAALTACYEHLTPGGLLLLNIPSSSGFFYRSSKFLFSMGYESPFERMWQKGFPSPHIHYFNPSNLSCLLQKYRFHSIFNSTLPVLRASGLYSRIAHTSSHGLLSRLTIYIATLIALPFLRIFPADIIYTVFKRD